MGVGFSFNLISSEFSIITAILILNIGGFWGFEYLRVDFAVAFSALKSKFFFWVRYGF